MQPLIYDITPKTSQSIQSVQTIKITYDSVPAAKLIKYGFNPLFASINLDDITMGQYFNAVLEFDYDPQSSDNFVDHLKEKIKVPKLNLAVIELLEIIILFGLTKSNPTISLLNSKSNQDILIDAINAYANKKIAKSTTKSASVIIDQLNVNSLMYLRNCVDEQTIIQEIMTRINDWVSMQTSESTIIVQLCDIKTQTLVEVLYYLSLHYGNAYIYKPLIVSSIADTVYLILQNPLAEKIKLDEINKTDIGTSNEYITSISVVPSSDFELNIQCMNSILMTKKFNYYRQIKSYMNIKVFEGIEYQQFKQQQRINADNWISIFIDKTSDQMEKYLADLLNYSQDNCTIVDRLKIN